MERNSFSEVPIPILDILLLVVLEFSTCHLLGEIKESFLTIETQVTCQC